MPNYKEKNYVLSDAGTDVPAKPGNTRKASERPKVSQKRGWVLITEALPAKAGKPVHNGSIYDEVVRSFSDGRRKSARVEMDGRTPKGIVQGLRASAKKMGLDNIKAYGRKVDGEERVYLVKE